MTINPNSSGSVGILMPEPEFSSLRLIANGVKNTISIMSESIETTVSVPIKISTGKAAIQ